MSPFALSKIADKVAEHLHTARRTHLEIVSIEKVDPSSAVGSALSLKHGDTPVYAFYVIVKMKNNSDFVFGVTHYKERDTVELVDCSV